MRVLVIIATALALGCAGPQVGHIVPLACLDKTSTPSSAIARYSPPRPRGFFLPPLPPPASVRGHELLARLIVDSSGTVMRDSIAICGIPDPSYVQRLAEALAKMSFEPARQDGSAIRAPVAIGYRF